MSTHYLKQCRCGYWLEAIVEDSEVVDVNMYDTFPQGKFCGLEAIYKNPDAGKLDKCPACSKP